MGGATNDGDGFDDGVEKVYSLDDLVRAKAHLEDLRERDSLDTSGNVDKYHTRINRARWEVEHIEMALKSLGKLPYSEKELLEIEIDRAFPKARSREIVEFKGQKFELRFSPKTKSRSGKSVTSWNRWWQKLS
jgi:hypothetical protein